MRTRWRPPHTCLLVFLCMYVALFSLVRYRPVSSGRFGRIVRSRISTSRLDRPVGVSLYKDEADINTEREDSVWWSL